MIQSGDILPFGRFKYKQPFIGSYKGMRFKIVHPKPAEGEEDRIYVEVWPGPNCYDKTDDSLKVKTSFEYSEEGYNMIIPYLNNQYDIMMQ